MNELTLGESLAVTVATMDSGDISRLFQEMMGAPSTKKSRPIDPLDVVGTGGEPPLGVFTDAPSTEDELIDAQKHCGRLEHELAMLKAGLGVGPKWSTTPPLMSGIYLACKEPSVPETWVLAIVDGIGLLRPLTVSSGRPRYWAGPLTVEAP